MSIVIPLYIDVIDDSPINHTYAFCPNLCADGLSTLLWVDESKMKEVDALNGLRALGTSLQQL